MPCPDCDGTGKVRVRFRQKDFRRGVDDLMTFALLRNAWTGKVSLWGWIKGLWK